MNLKLKLQFSIFCLVCFLVVLPRCAVFAQTQSDNIGTVNTDNNKELADTLVFRHTNSKLKKERIYHPDSTHSPMSAVEKSAIVPGWGQLYNNKWWKVPLIYGGLSSLTVTMVYNHRNYERYLRIYHYYNEPAMIKTTMPDYAYFRQLLKYNYTQEQIADAANGYDRDFQLSVLGIAGLWGLQMIDAYIDAKFAHSFSMDNVLSFRVSPGLLSPGGYAVNYCAVIPVLKITASF